MRSVIKIVPQTCCILNNPLQNEIVLMPGVFGVVVDLFSGSVTVDHTTELKEDSIKNKIIELGYQLVEDEFQVKSQHWESADKIAATKLFVENVNQLVEFNDRQKIIEVGCGTGLVGLSYLNTVRSLVMIDKSASMLEVLEQKLSYEEWEKVETIHGTLENYEGDEADRIMLFMSLHHISDIDKIIKLFYKNLKSGGKLIIGDLIGEDGSFHHPEIVPHNGFDTDLLKKMINSEGFNVVYNRVYTVTHKKEIDYPRFLLIAEKL